MKTIQLLDGNGHFFRPGKLYCVDKSVDPQAKSIRGYDTVCISHDSQTGWNIQYPDGQTSQLMPNTAFRLVPANLSQTQAQEIMFIADYLNKTSMNLERVTQGAEEVMSA